MQCVLKPKAFKMKEKDMKLKNDLIESGIMKEK